MRIISDAPIPIYTWADDIEAGALEQARNCARLPVAFHHVAVMADGHQGYGVPIGAVLALDNAISPYAVGNDIGCGMAVVPTDVAVRDLLAPLITRSGTSGPVARDHIMGSVQRSIPADTGGPPTAGRSDRDIDPLLDEAFDAMSEAVRVTGLRLSTSQSTDPLRGSPLLRENFIARGRHQAGTLGSGNHFVELLAGPQGNVWVMLHSGSRGIGSLVCNNFHRIALAACAASGAALPDSGLAWLPLARQGAAPADRWERAGACYVRALHAALAYADENRRRILGVTTSIVERAFPSTVRRDEAVSIHHNDATLEPHFGRMVWIHRKGAVKAAQDVVTITPGSMGTGTYLGRGLGDPLSFSSCAHGAGRVLSRGMARSRLSLQAELDLVRAGGGKVFASNKAAVIDEMPSAYKDLDSVMSAQADLVEPTCRLTPLATYKGVERDRRRGGWRPSEER